jgi:hypothetical protein
VQALSGACGKPAYSVPLQDQNSAEPRSSVSQCNIPSWIVKVLFTWSFDGSKSDPRIAVGPNRFLPIADPSFNSSPSLKMKGVASSQSEAATVLPVCPECDAVDDKLARLTTDTADAVGAPAGLDVAAACRRAIPWLAILESLNARSMGVAEGNDVKVPEGRPAPIERGGRVPVALVDGPAPVLMAPPLPPLPARETTEPATVAVPNPGKIV